MKRDANPIRMTIVWGLLSGLVYLPLSMTLSLMLPRLLSFQLVFWALLAGYGVLLTRWASKPLASIALPLFLLLFAAILIESTTAYIFAALGMLSWMRSGISFNHTALVKRLGVEMALGLGAGLPVSAAMPAMTLSGALGVWLFFLIQALYFIVFEYWGESTTRVEVDPFEKAKMAAEQILFR